jgi:hypothetical protein
MSDRTPAAQGLTCAAGAHVPMAASGWGLRRDWMLVLQA